MRPSMAPTVSHKVVLASRAFPFLTATRHLIKEFSHRSSLLLLTRCACARNKRQAPFEDGPLGELLESLGAKSRTVIKLLYVHYYHSGIHVLLFPLSLLGL